MKSRSALGLLVVGAGILWLLNATDVIDIGYSGWVGVLLIGVGLALLVSRGRYGLLVLTGIVVLLVGVPSILVDEDVFDDGVGKAKEVPQSSFELGPFRQGIGRLTVDLTEPGLELDGETVEASVGVGDLLVIVPLGTDVEVEARVGIGHAQAFGEAESGIDVDLVTDSMTTSGTQEFALDLEVGIGSIRVQRE